MIEPTNYNIQINKVTNFTIYINQVEGMSDTAHIINQLDNINIVHGKKHLLHLEFDGVMRNQTKDFRPQLPLIFRW